MFFVDHMPQEEYLKFVSSADIGLVPLYGKYTVTTYPSRAVSYMPLGIPIFAMINPSNDYGTIIQEQAKAGYYTIIGRTIG